MKDLEDAAGFPTSQGSAVYAGGPPKAADSPLVARLRAAGLRRRRQDEHAGDGLQGRHGQPARSAPPPTRGTSPAARAGRRAGPARRSRRAWCRCAPAPTAAARSASRRRSAGCPGSSRRSGACRWVVPSRPAGPTSPRRARWRARIRDVALALDVCVGPDADRPALAADAGRQLDPVARGGGARRCAIAWSPTLGLRPGRPRGPRDLRAGARASWPSAARRSWRSTRCSTRTRPLDWLRLVTAVRPAQGRAPRGDPRLGPARPGPRADDRGLRPADHRGGAARGPGRVPSPQREAGRGVPPRLAALHPDGAPARSGPSTARARSTASRHMAGSPSPTRST